LEAPRSLKLPMGCRLSALRKTFVETLGKSARMSGSFDGDAGDAISGGADGVERDEGISCYGHGRYLSGTGLAVVWACQTIWMMCHCLPSKMAWMELMPRSMTLPSGGLPSGVVRVS
jgi:hypothetical protein